MNISGVLVQSQAQHSAAISAEISSLPGVEVHAASDTGSLVVTIETDTTRALADTLSQIQALPKVLSATVIYHHDEEPDPQGDTTSQPHLAKAIESTGETS